MALIENVFANREALNESFANKIADNLNTAISQKGEASLAVSGGSTPKPLFQLLSNRADIDWEKVTVLLVDERWVSDDNDASNQTLVKQNLLQNQAAKAQYLSIKTDAATAEAAVKDIDEKVKVRLPIDVVILGMGGDGHTASLFPCSSELAEGLRLDNESSVIATQPTTAPHQRMSLTLASIASATNIYLHITSDDKKAVLDESLQQHTALERPIKAVADNAELQLMWAP
ncbi:6-phosphogluconolactonase [Agaribacter flavus]|uniref:6-phosphogluconolactonase n=1 Tax=Agaribacter flavus TaxID=1902781 RepID=A0ABV7FMY3_9ALTE